VAVRFTDPAGHKSLAVALALMTADEERRTALALAIVNSATPQEATPFSRWRPIPGVGNILALVRRDAIPASRRFPSVQDFAASGRLVNCAKASAGTRSGTSGHTMGTASLTWALSEAAVRLLRHNEPGPK
jgi:hypothetical protein